jgi:hypothetical protein
MDHDYEKMFNTCDEGSYVNLFKDSSQEFQNLFKKENCDILEKDKNYNFQVEEFMVDKSETKSNSKLPSPVYPFDVNSKFNNNKISKYFRFLSFGIR